MRQEGDHICLVGGPGQTLFILPFGEPIPATVGHDRDMADVWQWWHVQAGWALLALIELHALAALYRHYVRRDHILRAMLPGYRPGAETDGEGHRPIPSPSGLYAATGSITGPSAGRRA